MSNTTTPRVFGILWLAAACSGNPQEDAGTTISIASASMGTVSTSGSSTGRETTGGGASASMTDGGPTGMQLDSTGTTSTVIDTTTGAPSTGTSTSGESSGATSTGSVSTGSASTGTVPDCNLLLVEVLYDPSGDDGEREWVKLYNPCSNDIDLFGYSLGWGGDDYTYGSLDLSGIVPAGECFVIGGPTSVPENAMPNLDREIDLVPDLQNVDNGDADGVALFDVPTLMVDATYVPLDTVIYGGPNVNNLLDTDGFPGTPHVGDAPSSASIRRTALTPTWETELNPMPNACPPF